MAKLVNNTDSIGPYPGRTWKEEADALGDRLFGFSPVRDEYGRLCCPECQAPLEHDGARATYWQPAEQPTGFWCDDCELSWTPEEVKEIQ